MNDASQAHGDTFDEGKATVADAADHVLRILVMLLLLGDLRARQVRRCIVEGHGHAVDAGALIDGVILQVLARLLRRVLDGLRGGRSSRLCPSCKGVTQDWPLLSLLR